LRHGRLCLHPREQALRHDLYRRHVGLPRRVWEHKTGAIAGFTQRYTVHDLVYFEPHERIETAIQREHNMKHWPRRWKTALVDGMNPDWVDLYPTLF